MAIIHQGELRQVGAVEELTAGLRGKIEIVWHGTVVPASLKAIGGEFHVTGETARAIFPEDKQEAALEGLRREHVRLISLIPVRTSLEDYFVEQVKPAKETAGATA